MSESSTYRRIVGGETGVWAAPVRALLRALEGIYTLGVTLRNRRYDRKGAQVTLPIPVISVGNITAGGTGKTPLVIELVQRLESLGRNPAVISRGYKADQGEPNDEECLVRKHCPAVVCLADSDRGRAGVIAHREFGADVIVLDDGFQHRRLARTLDIVVVDATCPFGYGHLLPAGLLREPVEGLRRAHVVVVSRCGQVSKSDLARLETRLRDLAKNAALLQCDHLVTGIERLDGTPVEGSVEGERAVLFAGIGHPAAFRTTAQSLGVEVVGERWWPDHHHYRRGDIDALLKTNAFPSHDLLITTEKDAIKLAAIEGFDHARIAVIKITIDFAHDGGTILQSLLRDAQAES